MYVYIYILIVVNVFFLVFLPTNTDPGDIVLSSYLEDSSPNPLLGQVYIRRGGWQVTFRSFSGIRLACLGWACMKSSRGFTLWLCQT